MDRPDLVFDFDGWKLNGVAVGEEVAKLTALLGPEHPPEQGFLERLAGKVLGNRWERDSYLSYHRWGLGVEFEEGRVSAYSFDLQNLGETPPFAGRFTNAGVPVVLHGNTTQGEVKALFGEPAEADEEVGYLSYISGDYYLDFEFDESGRLLLVEAYVDELPAE